MLRFKLLFLILVTVLAAPAENFEIKSPNGKVETRITVESILTYSVSLKGTEIIAPSTISMQINKLTFGFDAKVKKVKTRSVSEVLKPVVPRKYAEVENTFNEMELQFKKGYSLIFRAYNDGVAYRWVTNIKDSITVKTEMVNFNFTQDHAIWFPEEESVFSHQERVYHYLKLSEITPSRFCSTGALIELNDGAKVYISESDLFDYPGMFLKGNKANPYGLQGKFAGFPLETNQINDRSVEVTKHAPYLAKTEGKRVFPWRVMIITKNDGQLVESEMIWKLANPSKINDPSWIKPGKVSWDWWNDNNVYGVDFKAGINTDTYKYYIDFASKYGLEYIILDEGWYHLEDVLKIKKEVDLPQLLAYAKRKHVGIILWVTWKALYDQLDLALQTFEDWGVKGIKVDFMQRDDQWMVNYYTLIAEKAARHHLLVDFHGAYKPTGLHRTWPNVLTFEGLAGMEQSKWGTKANPEHDLILPFIRMIAGPMDYTPGAMKNASQEDFRPIWASPMSQGTRCHQLGMYVVFESPLQMLSDSPSNYLIEEETIEFLKQVPTVWDDTKVLSAKVSDYILLARKKGKKWFIGAMTDWEERQLNISFDFLGEGNYSLQLWQDGMNANKHASDYKMKTLKITRDTILPIYLAKGGGWVGIVTAEDTKD